MGGDVLPPGDLIVGTGEGVLADPAAELFGRRWEPVEQIQLALAGKDLVVPLDMLQNRGADALSGCSDDVVCGETRRQPVGLGESDFPITAHRNREARPAQTESPYRVPVDMPRRPRSDRRSNPSRRRLPACRASLGACAHELSRHLQGRHGSDRSTVRCPRRRGRREAGRRRPGPRSRRSLRTRSPAARVALPLWPPPPWPSSTTGAAGAPCGCHNQPGTSRPRRSTTKPTCSTGPSRARPVTRNPPAPPRPAPP